MRLPIAFILLLCSQFALATDSTSVCDALPDETGLAMGGMSVIDSAWDEQVEQGHFKSTAPLYQETGDGIHRVNTDITIAWARLLPPEPKQARANIVIANGRTESYLKYKELAVTLWCDGYAVYLLDHRGQGLSSRILVYDNTSRGAEDARSPAHYVNRGHVESFDFYVQDLYDFVVDHAGLVANVPSILLAHSMGGGVAARLIQTHPQLFDAAILSSPMLDMPVRTFGCPAVDYIIEEQLGEDAYAPGRGPWVHEARYPYADTPEFKESVGRFYTSSEVRHNIWHETFGGPALTPDGRKVDLRIGGATNGWVDQACEAIDTIREEIHAIQIPVLLLIAQDDAVVPPDLLEEFCISLRESPTEGAACHRRLVTGARHEMLIERDFIRNIVLGHIRSFLEVQLAPPPE